MRSKILICHGRKWNGTNEWKNGHLPHPCSAAVEGLNTLHTVSRIECIDCLSLPLPQSQSPSLGKSQSKGRKSPPVLVR